MASKAWNYIMHDNGGRQAAELAAEGVVVSTPQDVLDILGDLMGQSVDEIVLHERNVTPAFFDLSTGLQPAGFHQGEQSRARGAIRGHGRRGHGRVDRDALKRGARAEVEKPESLAARGGCWFESDRTVVHLGVQQDFVPATKAHAAFTVADLDLLRERLTRAGCDVTGDHAVPGVTRFYAALGFTEGEG